MSFRRPRSSNARVSTVFQVEALGVRRLMSGTTGSSMPASSNAHVGQSWGVCEPAGRLVRRDDHAVGVERPARDDQLRGWYRSRSRCRLCRVVEGASTAVDLVTGLADVTPAAGITNAHLVFRGNTAAGISVTFSQPMSPVSVQKTGNDMVITVSNGLTAASVMSWLGAEGSDRVIEAPLPAALYDSIAGFARTYASNRDCESFGKPGLVS